MRHLSRLHIGLFLIIFISTSIADELTPIKTLDELSSLLGGNQDADKIESINENASLMFAIEGLGKEGDPVTMKIVTTYGPGKKFVEDRATVSANGKTADAFHAIWGPDGSGAIRMWVFRADGVAYGGRVYTDDESVIVKMEGEQMATTPEQEKQFGKGLSKWKGDLVFTPKGGGEMVVQAKNIVINGKIKLPDMKPETSRRITK